MNLDGIDVFVKVIQTGSFTAAAKALRMPTTTVSSKVAYLESRLGVTLIQRTTRKLQLTQAGTIFFKRCVIALEEIEAGENELSIGKTEPEGTLKISTVAELGHTILPDLIRGYLQQYPKMNIELILTPRVVDLVGEGIDLAIRYGQLKDSSLRAKKIVDVDFSLWASPEYIKKHGMPKNGRDLKKHTIIRFTAWSPTLRFSHDKEVIEVATSAKIVVDDLSTVKEFAVGGDGIGIIPSFMGKREAKHKHLVQVASGLSWGTVPLSFVYPPQRFVSLKVQSFMNWVEKNKSKVFN
ncbi:LysR family transcriptional regulator [Peredibacter starrii]|uniref:LysR family transcriptional regulator n=1 Tax=Peredibacter starrii TaxID=28202 RepID=A0AAX4HNG5_9BACT|nr:LysR family transcriptional regulator [Peredibacter starrii]WPU64829.1 LysR family transcriptional regulator [Peredibacter starrii]